MFTAVFPVDVAWQVEIEGEDAYFALPNAGTTVAQNMIVKFSLANPTAPTTLTSDAALHVGFATSDSAVYWISADAQSILHVPR